MKLTKFFSILLAGIFLMSCNTSKVQNDSTISTSVAPIVKDPGPSHVGAITPGKAEDHLIKEENGYILYSPNGTLGIRIETTGQMSYSVFSVRDGITTRWIRTSDLGVQVNTTKFYNNATVEGGEATELNISYVLNGNQRTADGHCMQAIISLSQDDFKYSLEVRAYDNGVAFRYSLPSMKINNLIEFTTYTLRQDITQCWYGVNNRDYEAVIASYSPMVASDDKITAPLTAVVKNNGGYISIMEGALNDSYPGVNLKAEGNATYSTCFYTTPSATPGTHVSGWRLINIADDLNGLVNNYNVYTVNDAPDSTLFADTSWIESGRSAWSWCTVDRTPTYETMKKFTIASALLGYEYNIIDDGWPSWPDYQKQLKSLGRIGEDLNVKQILWCAMTAGTSGVNKLPEQKDIDAYFRLLESTQMSGAKVDFWWSEADTKTTKLQNYVLKEAAKRQMVIDFHGCNKNTGFNVTYPNELSREGIRGLEIFSVSNTANLVTYAEMMNTQLYTRFLCGHADWTPATYNAMEIASLILIDSPMMVVATHPEDILTSPACEFIKSIPTTWDQTVVLSSSKIGKYSVYAKENNGTWFVGGIASSPISGANVKLGEFLPAGTYTAEVWVDGPNGMETKTITVTEKDQINLGSLSEGKGFAIRISKLSLSRYGGVIGTIAVNAPAGATVKYTTDGSNPLTSKSAVVTNGTINVSDSCRLQVAITDGDGKGTLLSYQFNKIDPVYTISTKLTHIDNKTTLNISVGEGATVYYTTDGSAPTTSSAVAGSVLEFSESCTLRYLVVSDNRTLDGQLSINIIRPVAAPVSDLPLTNAKPISATVGWGSIYYDTSMAPSNGMSARQISLGGTTTENGTKFSRGISANSVATLNYAVPKDYTRFVAVAGIDNCVFKNAVGCSRAKATVKIAFDGKVVLETSAFGMGAFVYIDVAIPENAQVMTITFTDGGNGNTCDNVSMAMPGWVK